MKLRGLVHNCYIHASVTDRGNILIAQRYMNAGIGKKAAQFHFWYYKNLIFFAVNEYIRQRTHTFFA